MSAGLPNATRSSSPTNTTCGPAARPTPGVRRSSGRRLRTTNLSPRSSSNRSLPASPGPRRRRGRRYRGPASALHWHLNSPRSLPSRRRTLQHRHGLTGGFSAVLGNPRGSGQRSKKGCLRLRDANIAEAKNAAARKKAITALADTHPELLAEFNAAKRASEAESQPPAHVWPVPALRGRDVNTYSVFAEHFRTVLAPQGRSGIITPHRPGHRTPPRRVFADTLRPTDWRPSTTSRTKARSSRSHHAFRSQ